MFIIRSSVSDKLLLADTNEKKNVISIVSLN